MNNFLNEAEIFDTWAPMITEKTNISDPAKLDWLSKYCHFHTLNDGLNEGDAFQGLSQLNGMGQIKAPSRGADGSGDKFPSLLPLAIQVAANTHGFDMVSVVPMQNAAGILTFLDYVYAGGNPNTKGSKPVYISLAVTETGQGTSFVQGNQYHVGALGGRAGDSVSESVLLKYVGRSRMQNLAVFQVLTIATDLSIADCVKAAMSEGPAPAANGTQTAYIYGADGTTAVPNAYFTGDAGLVSAMENHFEGFTGAGANNTDDHQGPFLDQNGNSVSPMNRETGEVTFPNKLGMKTYTKIVEAQTYQVAIGVTQEQITDLRKGFGIDVLKMVENAALNQLSQSINKHILNSIFSLGKKNKAAFQASEGSNLDLDLSQFFTQGNGYFENQMTLQRRILSRILAAANVITQRGRRGPATGVIIGPALATAIQDISTFQVAPMSNTLTQNAGQLYPVGKLNGALTVYVDQNMKWNDMRVSVFRKGADDEPGLKFCPYMMADTIQTISEGTLTPIVAVKSRYALVQAGFYPESMYITFNVTLGANNQLW